jgi:NitT/TauT family transport system substrate-binding protein
MRSGKTARLCNSCACLTERMRASAKTRLRRSTFAAAAFPQQRNRDIWIGLTILVWLTGLFAPELANPAAQPVERRPLSDVVIAYSSISGNMAPLWVTYEQGFFRKYGLRAEIVLVKGGSRAAESLASGDVALAQMAGAGVIQTSLKGADTVMIAGILNTMNYQFIVDKSIQRPDQLKGKALAVSRYGSSSDFAVRFALDKYGLVPQKDVRILEIGTQPDRFAALAAGRVQGVMLEVPQSLEAKKMGFRVLANLKMLGLEYQHTGLATTRALIKSQPDLLRDVMKAYIEGIHFYKTHRQESLAVLAKYLKTNNADALKEIYEDIGLALVPAKPYPTLKGIEAILQEIASKEPQAQSVRPEQFVDVRFVKELDDSGFIDRLYKTKPVVVADKPPRLPVEPIDYRIKAGDTLSGLAEWFYGNALKWQRIYEANRKLIVNPNYIYIGQKITVPPAI